MAPDFFNDDAQSHYFEELREILKAGDLTQITDDHVQALQTEIRERGLSS